MMNPLSALFGAGVRLRNTVYDRQIIKAYRLDRPVVSIGNLSVGGTGKTPFVIMLGRALKERGIPFDVFSRGYGRRFNTVTFVNTAGSPLMFGDEPLLIARKLGVPVLVGADRFGAGLLAEAQFPRNKLHLMDDGFQHRRLHRDFDIVLIADQDLRDTLLPVGRLREPFSSLRRADAVVLESGSAQPPLARTMWRVRRQTHFLGLRTRVVAFCGIARPEQFFSSLKKLGLDLARTIAFPDHHFYAHSDIERLLRAKQQTGAHGFISTEKDAINLGALARQLQTFETAELELELEDPEQRISELLSVLEERCGCRF